MSAVFEELVENREESLRLVDQHVMTCIRDLDEAALRKLACQFSCCRSRKQSALLAANQECRAGDLSGVGSRSTGDPKPPRIEFVSESPLVVLLNRVCCDVEAQGLACVARIRNEAKTLDRVLSIWVGTAERQGEAGAPPRASAATAGQIYEDDAARLREAARMIEGDARAHGMTNQIEIFASETMDQGFEVVTEGTDAKLLRKVRVPVPPKIQGVDGSKLGEFLRDVIPPMRVCPAAVEKDERNATPVVF